MKRLKNKEDRETVAIVANLISLMLLFRLLIHIAVEYAALVEAKVDDSERKPQMDAVGKVTRDPDDGCVVLLWQRCSLAL